MCRFVPLVWQPSGRGGGLPTSYVIHEGSPKRSLSIVEASRTQVNPGKCRFLVARLEYLSRFVFNHLLFLLTTVDYWCVSFPRGGATVYARWSGRFFVALIAANSVFVVTFYCEAFDDWSCSTPLHSTFNVCNHWLFFFFNAIILFVFWLFHLIFLLNNSKCFCTILIRKLYGCSGIDFDATVGRAYLRRLFLLRLCIKMYRVNMRAFSIAF